jgi:tRNA G37 N-methylase TrmD
MLGMLMGMSPLMKTLMKFAQSRQGRKLTDQAKTYAKSPKGKRQIEQARAQLTKAKKPR